MSTPLVDPPDGHVVLTVAEVARALGARPRTVLAHLERGTIPGWKHPGGHWRVPAAAVQRLRVEFGISPNGSEAGGR